MSPATTDSRSEVADPVCGEVFPPDLAVFSSTSGDRTVWFCSKTCKETFDADPGSFPPQEAQA